MISSAKQQTDYQSALVVGQSLADRLSVFCTPEKCVIAGSLRRKEAWVHDIEIVCIPRRATAIPAGDLFPKPDVNLVVNHIRNNSANLLDCRGFEILKAGDRYIQVLFCGLQCDIFMTTPEQWGRMLAIRTGPASFNKSMFRRAKDRGYQAKDGRLVSQKDIHFAPLIPDEYKLFELLGWDYIKPEHRG